MIPFLVALQFLTIVPLRLPRAPTSADYAASIAWYPCVGLLVGTPGAAAAWALAGHLPATLVALAVLAFPAIVTGALHLDGLADCCDAIFAPRSTEERLAILKDSRVGVFGAVGLGLLLVARFAALATVPPAALPVAALLAPTLGRWAIVLGLRWLPPAKPGEGLAALFAERGRGGLVVASLTAAAAAALLVRIWALPALVAAALIAAAAGRLAVARLGGATGDVYGATSECAELVIQLGCAAVATWR